MGRAFLFPYEFVVSLIIYSTLFPVQSHSHSINHKTNHNNNGFSISVIHRDSPLSPFYNHSMTTYERVSEAARRSINRQNHHLMSLMPPPNNRPPVDIPIKLMADRIEYLTTINVGSSKTKLSLTLDTGSGLNWVMGPPFYNASNSISYRLRSCSIDKCPPRSTCNTDQDTCEYQITYFDESSSSGTISYDDFTFADPDQGSTVTVTNLMFGYGTNVTSFQYPENGILALNMDSESFLTLLGATRFSHCLAPYNSLNTGGTMNFGLSATMGDFATAIIKNSKNGNYYVDLDVVAIGEKWIDMPEGVFKLKGDGSGGVIVDTGTTFTQLINEAYEPFINEMRQRVKRPLVKADNFDLCFNGNLAELDDVPDVTFRFANVGIQLMKQSVYMEVDVGIVCLAILGGPEFTIFGNYQMRNLLVGYDLQKMQISFSVANCIN